MKCTGPRSRGRVPPDETRGAHGPVWGADGPRPSRPGHCRPHRNLPERTLGESRPIRRADGDAPGTVEKFREGVSPDWAPYFKFRLSDEQTAVRVFSFGRSPCRNGMQATVEGIFEKVNRLGRLPYYQQVTATRVTCR
jgi:hypothetical protein